MEWWYRFLVREIAEHSIFNKSILIENPSCINKEIAVIETNKQFDLTEEFGIYREIIMCEYGGRKPTLKVKTSCSSISQTNVRIPIESRFKWESITNTCSDGHRVAFTLVELLPKMYDAQFLKEMSMILLIYYRLNCLKVPWRMEEKMNSSVSVELKKLFLEYIVDFIMNGIVRIIYRILSRLSCNGNFLT